MKALFVLHEIKFIYGANRSISELLKAVDYDFDILICKSFTVKVDETEIRNLCGKHLQKIYICWLPRYRVYHYDRLGAIQELSHIVNNVMAWLFAKKRKKIIKQGNYDYVHLNSVVLFPVLDNSAAYIMHVREIINPDYYNIKNFIRKIQKASGIICIDEATKKALEQIMPNLKNLVLNNPFNMLGLEETNYEESLRQYGLSADNTIFALIGRVTESKGAKLVIRAFMRHQNDKSRLLIVGNANHAYGKECQEMAKDDKRIIFCGELKDTRGIYRISDYIIRGDAEIGIGRTMYEGLYAGAGIIIPGSIENLQFFPEKESFKEKIFFYPLSNEMELCHIIENQSQVKQTDRRLYSNVEDYIKKYKKYINEVIGN